ncbi:MAG: pilus assembly protein PilM [Alicyclobacillaceae bacterium]|nr:pilus assembly protein PilM [Alicyclobacillaceae bacterium]
MQTIRSRLLPPIALESGESLLLADADVSQTDWLCRTVAEVERSALGEPLALDVNLPARVRPFAAGLRKLVREHGWRGRRVAIGLPGDSVLLRHLSLPRMPMRALRLAVKHEVERRMQLPIANPVYDFAVVPAAPDAKQTDVIVVAAARDDVMPWVELAASCGLRPVWVEPSALALVRAVQAATSPDAPDRGPGAAKADGQGGGSGDPLSDGFPAGPDGLRGVEGKAAGAEAVVYLTRTGVEVAVAVRDLVVFLHHAAIRRPAAEALETAVATGLLGAFGAATPWDPAGAAAGSVSPAPTGMASSVSASGEWADLRPAGSRVDALGGGEAVLPAGFTDASGGILAGVPGEGDGPLSSAAADTSGWLGPEWLSSYAESVADEVERCLLFAARTVLRDGQAVERVWLVSSPRDAEGVAGALQDRLGIAVRQAPIPAVWARSRRRTARGTAKPIAVDGDLHRVAAAAGLLLGVAR